MTSVSRRPPSLLVASAAGAMFLDVVAAEVIDALEQAGVASVLLKGPVLARWLYQPGEVRSYIDVDLLVPADREPEAAAVLTGLGFATARSRAWAEALSQHAVAWRRFRDGATVDLHVDLPSAHARPDLVWCAVWESIERMALAGREVPIPGQGCRALIVALHAIHHGTTQGQPLEDLARALAVVPASTWTEAAGVASQLGITGALAAGLRLLPAGAVLADDLGLPATGSAVVMLQGWELDADVRSWALAWYRLTAAPGMVAKARMVTSELFPPRAVLPEYEPEARRGGLAVAATYVRRPFRVAPKVLPGLRVWRRARRAAGETTALVVRAELLGWSVLARAGAPLLGVKRTLQVLDRLGDRAGPVRPTVQAGGPGATFNPHRAMVGVCVHQAMARSQYLRRRGHSHDLVLGARGGAGRIAAHAWLEPYDDAPPDFVALHRFRRIS